MENLRFAFCAAVLCCACIAARGDDFGLDEAGDSAAPADPWAGITQLFPAPGDPVAGRGEELRFVGEYDLPDTAPEGVSGIAWRGNTPGLEETWADLYALVEDSGGLLHSATVGIDRDTGAITNAAVSPAGSIPGAADLESVDCGAVPVAGGTVPAFFASDERGPAIWARAVFDASGPEWTPLPLPEPLRHCRFNRALESLALSADGRILWTAPEGPLPEDGPEPAAERGAPVRLYGLPVSGLFSVPDLASFKQAPPAWPEEPAFRFYELDPALGAHVSHLPGPFNGLADLCALPDGRLLALERNYGFRTRSAADPRGSLITISIYLVDPLHAEGAESNHHAESAELGSHAEFAEGAESPSAARTAAATRPPVLAKTLLWRGMTGRANYEGMTLGPVLSDGSRALVLVADGDVTRKGSFAFPWRKSLLSFRLSLP